MNCLERARATGAKGLDQLLLATMMDAGPTCYLSNETLVERTGIAPRSIYNILKRLEAAGVIVNLGKRGRVTEWAFRHVVLPTRARALSATGANIPANGANIPARRADHPKGTLMTKRERSITPVVSNGKAPIEGEIVSRLSLSRKIQ